MTTLIPELRELIESGPMAHLTTLNPDGSPQMSIVWIGLDGDDIVSGHVKRLVKLDNMEQDPRVVLTLRAPKESGIMDDGIYRVPYARIQARATVVETDEVNVLWNRLSKVYMEPDTPELPPFLGYSVRYSVEHVDGIGPWGSGEH
jgi:PPOX class probable F420-dependent enzyme